MSEGKQTLIKLVMLGVGGVGKSSLTLQFLYREFNEDYVATEVDSFSKELSLDGDEIKLDILDTAGQEEYAFTKDNYYRSGDGFVLVFSITESYTFDEIRGFREQILRVKNDKLPKDIPMIVIGNKCDLDGKRQVSEEDAMNEAMKWGCKYMETSAKTNLNVDNAFYDIMRQVHSIKKPKRTASDPVSAKPCQCCTIS